jgi:hypothetical protein
VPLIDPRTNLIDRAWYLFFLSLQDIATAVVDDGGTGADAISLLASYDAALLSVNQELQTLPPVVTLPIPDVLTDCCSDLVSQTAEMQKQIEGLYLLPPPSQGTVTTVTATAPVVSSGGTAPDISMPAASTSVSGYLTSTDWNTFNGKAPSTSGTSILYGNGSGGFSNVTVGTGLSFTAGTLASTATASTAPLTKTADFTVGVGETWFINNKSGSTCTVTLPSAATYTGRELTFKNMQAQTLVSASSNVVLIDSTTAGTAILLAVVGNWATLVSDGTNWIVMQQAANNCLLLE